MSNADDLYAEGARQYQQRDYAGAERTFRRLLQIVPNDRRKEWGRAAYSLALAEIGQGKLDEARHALVEALKADPELQRARDKLAELDQPVLKPRTKGGLIGMAVHVETGSEPDPWFGQQRNLFLAFRLQHSMPGLPAAPTIVLRGQRIQGSIKNQDIVEIPGPWRPGQRPQYVLNHTTGETIRVGQSGSRIAQWVMLIVFLAAFAGFAFWVYSNLFANR